jgi:hypothetical protein
LLRRKRLAVTGKTGPHANTNEAIPLVWKPCLRENTRNPVSCAGMLKTCVFRAFAISSCSDFSVMFFYVSFAEPGISGQLVDFRLEAISFDFFAILSNLFPAIANNSIERACFHQHYQRLSFRAGRNGIGMVVRRRRYPDGPRRARLRSQEREVR